MTKRKRSSVEPWRSRIAGCVATRQRRETLRHLLRAQAGKCAICGCPMTMARNDAPTMATVDHIIPVSKGGTDSPSNLRAACYACNQARGNGEP